MKTDGKKVLKKYLSTNDFCHDLGFEPELIKGVADRINDYYFDNPKIDKKGKLRPFHCTKGIANVIQKRIHEILKQYDFPDYMFGVVGGKSISDNAKIHLGAKVVVTIDIKDCFPSTTEDKVLYAFKKTLGFSNKVSGLLVKLTTYQGTVPQGTHSSSVVVALCLLPICKELDKFCQSNNLGLSIWADDIAISGDNPEQFISNYFGIIGRFGYSCKREKIKIWRGKAHKEITGRAVDNNRLTIPKKKVEECKKMIINMKKGLYDSSILPSLLGKMTPIKQVDAKAYQSIVSLAVKLGVSLK